MEQDKESRAHRYGPLLGGIAVLAVFGLVAYLVLGGMHGAKAPEPPKVQEISLVQPPPPRRHHRRWRSRRRPSR